MIKFVLKIYSIKIIPKNIHRLHSTFQISLTKYPRFVRLSKVQYIFLKKIRNSLKKGKNSTLNIPKWMIDLFNTKTNNRKYICNTFLFLNNRLRSRQLDESHNILHYKEANILFTRS